MRKRILSLLLALVLVLGLVPVTAMADDGLYGDTNNNGTVDVYLSLSNDAQFAVPEATEKVMAMVPVSLPYFDLSLYGLEEYYFSTETYGSDGSGGPGSILPPGDEDTARNKVTMLHLYLYATEEYYCGVDGGTGYLKDEIGTETLTFSGGRGSSFMEQFWGGSCNLNYYRNYVYPLASPGHGATADQILLRDGDVVTLGHFSLWDFYTDPLTVFNHITAPKNTVVSGEEIELSVMRAGKDITVDTAATADVPVTSEPNLYYWRVDNDALPSGDVTEWHPLGQADGEGKFMLNTEGWLPGTYFIALPGLPGENSDAIVSTPGGMLLTVTEPSAPQVKYGDVDGDGEVTGNDALKVQRYVVELDTEINETAADVDGEEGITGNDALVIQRRVVELITKFPIES